MKQEKQQQLTFWENAKVATWDAMVALANFPCDFAQGFKKSGK